MKKIIILIQLFCIVFISNAQNLKTTYFIEYSFNIESEFYETDITITPSTITIKKWNNGKKNDAIMKIDKTVIKPYDGIDCTWYYCSDTHNDPINGFTKNICIYNKIKKEFTYVNFATEIDVFKYNFYLK